jgi:hypothetical protein
VTIPTEAEDLFEFDATSKILQAKNIKEFPVGKYKLDASL